jgi:hypothetical protein
MLKIAAFPDPVANGQFDRILTLPERRAIVNFSFGIEQCTERWIR